MNRVKEWLKLIRVPGVFTAHADILAGFLIAGGTLNDLFSLFMLLMASSCMFSAGMALNDFFDFHEDRIKRPERPLPSGKISRGEALGTGIFLLIAGNLFASGAGMVSFGVAFLLSVFIFSYDGRLKRHPVLGPLNMGGCRYLNLLLGLSILPLNFKFLALPLLTFIFISGLTFLARIESCGGKSVLHVTVAMLSIMMVPFLYFILWFFNILPVVTGLFLNCLWALVCIIFVSQLFKKHAPGDYQNKIKYCLISIIILNGTIAAGIAPLILALAIWLLVIPTFYIAKLIYMT